MGSVQGKSRSQLPTETQPFFSRLTPHPGWGWGWVEIKTAWGRPARGRPAWRAHWPRTDFWRMGSSLGRQAHVEKQNPIC